MGQAAETGGFIALNRGLRQHQWLVRSLGTGAVRGLKEFDKRFSRRRGEPARRKGVVNDEAPHGKSDQGKSIQVQGVACYANVSCRWRASEDLSLPVFKRAEAFPVALVLTSRGTGLPMQVAGRSVGADASLFQLCLRKVNATCRTKSHFPF